MMKAAVWTPQGRAYIEFGDEQSVQQLGRRWRVCDVNGFGESG